MKDYYNLIIDGANSDFNTHIPKIFYENIKNTFEDRKTHIEEIKTLHHFYRMIRYYHPTVYISKSKIRHYNDSGFCPMPGVDGTVENAIRLFEKQYFDILYLLLGGMYRPIMIILRYILEQSTWIAASVIDKEVLTGDTREHNEAMSHIEFKHFLHTNMLNFEIKKANKKSRLRTISGIKEVPYIQHINAANGTNGIEAIKYVYSELSKYAHANIWSDLQDNEDDPTHFENTNMYVAKPSFKGYHKILKLILESHKMIFYLLLIAAYENIGYYNPDTAEDFFKDIRMKVNKMQSKIMFKDIMKLLENPPSIGHGLLKKNCNDYDEEEKSEHDLCPKCGYECVCDEKCPACESNKYYIPYDNNQYML